MTQVKARPDELAAGTAGIGSASHLGGMLLNSALGTDVELVGYKGAGPAMNDLVGGHIAFMVDVSTTALPQIRAGTVRPLAVLRGQRIAALPDVPTTAETGLEGMEANIWNLLLAPQGTPRPVMDRLAGALREVTEDPGIRQKLAQLGVEPSVQGGMPAPQIEAAGVSAD